MLRCLHAQYSGYNSRMMFIFMDSFGVLCWTPGCFLNVSVAYRLLVQERRNSSALAMELRLSCTNPSICVWYMTFVSHIHMGASHTVAKWLEQPFDITQILRSSLCDGNIRMRKISRVIQNNTYVKRPWQHFDSYSHHHHWQQYSIIMYHVL